VEFPPIFEPDRIIFPLAERISIMGGMACLFLIILDYLVYSWKKVIHENLSKKILFLPLLMFLIVFGTNALYTHAIFSYAPVYYGIFPFILGMSSLIIVLIQMPSIVFLALINPQHFAIVSRNGNMLCSEQIGDDIEPILIHEAVSVINIIFNEYRTETDKTNIQQLDFPPDQICYVEFREQFFVILLDTHFSSYMRDQIQRFAKRIESQVNDLIAYKIQDVKKFSFVNETFREMFAFIPKFA
jgi:hypothetical protein